MDKQNKTDSITANSGNCCICGASDAETHNFTFHYGKKKGRISRRRYNQKITQTDYEYGGSCSDTICINCYRKSRRSVFYLFAFLLLATVIVSIILKFIIHYKGYPIMLMVIELILALLTLAAYRDMKKGKFDISLQSVSENGSLALINAKRKEFTKLGYNAFWTSNTYENIFINQTPHY
jgi:hypothetical protein